MSFVMTQDLINSISNLSLYKPKESNRIALRTCNYCKKSAYTEEELTLFVAAKMYKFGRRNTCKNCYALLASHNNTKVPLNIVGPYCKLSYKNRSCVSCGLPITISNVRLFMKYNTNGEWSFTDKCEACRLKTLSNKKPSHKPSSLAVRSFLTSQELSDIATLKTIEINNNPEDFLNMLEELTSFG